MQLPTNMEKPTVIMLYLRAVLFLGTGQAVIFVRRNATFVVGRLADEPNLWRPLLHRRRRPLLLHRRRRLSTCLKKKQGRGVNRYVLVLKPNGRDGVREEMT